MCFPLTFAYYYDLVDFFKMYFIDAKHKIITCTVKNRLTNVFEGVLTKVVWSLFDAFLIGNGPVFVSVFKGVGRVKKQENFSFDTQMWVKMYCISVYVFKMGQKWTIVRPN